MPGNAGVYSLSVSQPRYTLLIACERLTGTPIVYVQLYHYAVSDGSSLTASEECASSATQANVAITGTVTNLPMGDSVQVADGISTYGGAVTTWNMPAQAGPGTLLAVHRAAASSRPIGLVLQKPTFADGQSFAIDINTQVLPSESSLTIDPTATSPFVSTTYIDEHGTNFSIESSSTALPTYRVVPADRVGDGLSLVSLSSSANSTYRQMRRYFKTPTAQTLTLPAAFLPAAPTVASTTPYAMPAMSLPVQGYARYYYVSYSSSMAAGAASAYRFWTMYYSAAWLGGAATVEATTPDLTAIPGWGAAWGLFPTNRSWYAAAYGGPLASQPLVTGPDSRGRQPGLWKDGDAVPSSSTSGSF